MSGRGGIFGAGWGLDSVYNIYCELQLSSEDVMDELAKTIVTLITQFGTKIVDNRIKIALFFWIVPFVFLILPLDTTKLLAIDFLISDNRAYLGIIFLFFFLLWIFLIIENMVQQFSVNRKRNKILENLTETECKFLLPYMTKRTKTITYSLFRGEVAGLVEKGIIYRADSKETRVGEQDFNIHNWAFEKIITNNKILLTKIPKEQYDESKGNEGM